MTSTGAVMRRLQVRPWFRDHCFNGRVILPAVEAMALLAAAVRDMHPMADVQVMTDATFARFLEIPPDRDEIDLLIEVAPAPDGRIQARLLTRKRLKAMTRLTVHCNLFFGDDPEVGRTAAQQPAMGVNPVTRVSAERIYRELVPFGPVYRTLHGQVSLAPDSALGRIRTPDLPVDFAPVGSPFSLDGTMHAACVHGQRLADFVPFPVGFAARTIALPTEPGGEYIVQARLRSRADDELVYDLWILDRKERIRETLSGLRMRDVTNGRSRPPEWIRAGSSCRA